MTSAATLPELNDSSQGAARRWPEWVPIAFIVVITLIEICRLSLPLLLRSDLYHFDACQHVWWTYRYRDPDLFPNDKIAEYMSRPTFATYGYKFLYWVFVRFVDPQTFSESLPFVTAIPITLMAFHIGRRVSKGSMLGGMIGVFYIFYAELMRDTNGGFPRSFGVPLLLFGMWMLLDRCIIGLGIALLLAAFMYPPVLLTLGMTTAVTMAVRLYRERKLPARWPWLVALGTASLILVGSVYASKLPAWMGPKVSRAEAMQMPEFQKWGRSEFFHPTNTFGTWKDFYFTDQRSGVGMHFEKFAWCVVLAIATAIVFRGSIPIEAWAMVGSSFLLFLVAHLTLFTLYLPNRQTIFTVPIFGMIWLCALLPRIVNLPMPMMREISAALSARWVSVVVCLFALVAWGTTSALQVYGNTGIQSNWEPREPHTIHDAFVWMENNLPKDALVAAHPYDADHVPLRARRSVLAYREVAMPFHLGFYRWLKERLVDELAACYATVDDWAEIDKLADKYGVDVFLVNDRRYTDVKSINFHRPFTAANWQMVTRGQKLGFALLHPPEDRVLWKSSDGEIMVVQLRKTATTPATTRP